jgi:hypothetical protein
LFVPLASSDVWCWTQGAFLNSSAASVVEERRQIDLADATGGAIVWVAARQSP